MNEETIIIAAIIGLASSTITLFLTAVIDYFKVKITSNLEMKKIVFLRKTHAVEQAVSWYQEGIDCYSMMKMACQELDGSYNPITVEKFIQSTSQARKLYTESNVRLNPLYLYFDFRKIEEKHNVYLLMKYINDILVEVGKDNEKAVVLAQSGKDENDSEIKEIKIHTINLLHKLPSAFDDQIKSLVEMQEELRKAYDKLKS